MYKRNWQLFVADMVETIIKIAKYTENMSFEEFVDDDKTQDAVIRNLEILGEAANKIPKEIQERYPNIPWHQIIGMRNRLIHAYFVVDYEIVWKIITSELPGLLEKLGKLSDSA